MAATQRASCLADLAAEGSLLSGDLDTAMQYSDLQDEAMGALSRS
jgi:hypothetical protein